MFMMDQSIVYLGFALVSIRASKLMTENCPSMKEIIRNVITLVVEFRMARSSSGRNCEKERLPFH